MIIVGLITIAACRLGLLQIVALVVFRGLVSIIFRNRTRLMLAIWLKFTDLFSTKCLFFFSFCVRKQSQAIRVNRLKDLKL